MVPAGIFFLHTAAHKINSLAMQPFTKRAIEIIKAIPEGFVCTYGIIADAAGNHQGARQISRILHSSSEKYDLPWHRVVNRHGELPPRANMSHLRQRTLLEAEGVHFDHRGKIDFCHSLWIPKPRV